MIEDWNPPDEASESRVIALTELKSGAHIHIIGICGTGVSAVARLLKDLGFKITGSDTAFYPPIGDIVRGLADQIFERYDAANLALRPDAVIIGNAIRRDNPEALKAIADQIPYASMPEAFAAFLIGDRQQCGRSVVVSGTHGKTTTSAIIATMLDIAGRKPGYFIGGVPRDLPGNLRGVSKELAPQDRIVVLEGDEYDSAFFAKWSKFQSYRPDIAVVTSLEFDHADIFSSIEDIEREFFAFLRKVPRDGEILVFDGSDVLQRAIPRWRGDLTAKISFYGSGASSSYRLIDREQVIVGSTPAQRLVMDIAGKPIELTTSLTGSHNAYNLLVGAAVGSILGLSSAELERGLSGFTGVLRRQNVRGEFNGRLLIEDFAHHPTAVDTTLQGLKDAYPNRRLVAVFEPRSNTSRRNVFQTEYEKCFSAADVLVIQHVAAGAIYSKFDTEDQSLDATRIAEALEKDGKAAFAFSTVAEIQSWILQNSRPGDLICVMSNGDFGGLIGSLSTTL